MTARLRVLPISTRDEGQPQHYLILDNVSGVTQAEADRTVERLSPRISEAGGVLLVFGVQVDLPDVDETYADHAREEHAREQAYKAAHWEKDPDTPGAVREIRASPEEPAEEAPEEAPVEEPAPVCKALREVEHSGFVPCDGTGHDREHHSGRLTAGPFVGQRWVWPFSPTDHAKREEAPQAVTVVVNVQEDRLAIGQQIRDTLRQYERVNLRRA